MNTLTPVQPAPSASAAQQHLEQNRALIAAWLEQDRQGTARLSPLERAASAVVPLLTGANGVGGVALLGALVQAWLRREASSAQAGTGSGPLAQVLGLARRHPRTTLLAIGMAGLAAYTWSRAPATEAARRAIPAPGKPPVP